LLGSGRGWVKLTSNHAMDWVSVTGREFSKIVPNHCPRLGVIAPEGSPAVKITKMFELDCSISLEKRVQWTQHTEALPTKS
jgi:hypothetical protein